MLTLLPNPAGIRTNNKALVSMVDRSHIKEDVIVIADRYYEGYNDFAYIEKKGWKYIIRVKDLGSTRILSKLSLPSDLMMSLMFSFSESSQENRPMKLRQIPKFTDIPPP